MTAIPIDHSHRRRPEHAHRRTFAPVRRNSQAAGREKWPTFTRKMGNRLILALKIHQEKQRRKGERTGTAPRDAKGDPGGISHGAIRLAEFLVNIAVSGAGRLEPSVEHLAYKLNVPAKTIHAWKAQLKRHGFLEWRRRWVETGREGVRGPQVAQTSNAYWLKGPKAALQAADKAADKGFPQPERQDRIRQLDPVLAKQIEALDAAAARRAEREAARHPGRRIDGT